MRRIKGHYYFLLFFIFFQITGQVFACNDSAIDQDRGNTNSDSEIKPNCLRNQKQIEYPYRLIIRFNDTNSWIVVFSKSISTPVFKNKVQIKKFQKAFHSYSVDRIYDLTGDATFSIAETAFKKTSTGIVVGNKTFPSEASLGFNLLPDGKMEQIYPDPSAKEDTKANPDVVLFFKDIVYGVTVKNAELKDIHFKITGKKKQKDKFVTLEGETSLTAFGVRIQSKGGNLYVNDQLISDHQSVVIENSGTYKVSDK